MDDDPAYELPNGYRIIPDLRSNTFAVTRGGELLGHTTSKQMAYNLILNSRRNYMGSESL